MSDCRKKHVVFFDPNPNPDTQLKLPPTSCSYHYLISGKGYRCPCGNIFDPKYYDHCPYCQRVVLAHKKGE